MSRGCVAVGIVALLTQTLFAETHVTPVATPQPLRFAQTLLPQVVEMIAVSAVAASGGPHAPRYASISLGKDEYVYSLTDRKFIRVIKDQYELPAWRLCGDWASVRVALMGEFMEASAPVSVWFLTYRDDHWVRLQRDEEGRFFKNFQQAELPPYAVRCFNLDQKELTD